MLLQAVSIFFSFEFWRAGKGENYNPFACDSAYIRVQAQNLKSYGIFYHGIKERPGFFYKRLSHFFYKISTFASVLACACQLMFSLCKHSFEPHKNDIIDYIGFRFQGTAPHIFFFKTYESFAYCSFQLPFT